MTHPELILGWKISLMQLSGCTDLQGDLGAVSDKLVLLEIADGLCCCITRLCAADRELTCARKALCINPLMTQRW